ncbi:general transcription factor 3C polypeptide 1-like [Acanthaster planci]|uniref:General transcription factor 3C polypeptide 1-like n=1 Tax=Acanthaster planci TaxID=133434 RepID=A0A8B7ZPC4_ACAPL|nr:general transcription factor 3C polypeptide 1-like [Acanthaster planci]XP_022107269.1 general transcription factor 3C polypeptide 1-like [Acanthaster planci]XP_022107270.1 general transcription factor 3C polypeptide 1-like [Acanthaster planci]XP_022107271.1 general transcription factor 3C polypeptide 1-like [Acanthaster planci]
MSYLHDICLDEIALEGLDGITLACLWCRLDQRLPKFPLALDPKSKQFLWKGIIASQDVAFYHLPIPRDLPAFPHEFRTIDETTGIVSLQDKVSRNEYPACIINNSETDGIQGSCATFNERVDISEEVRGHDRGNVMTLEEVQERWGDSLVVVGSQELRFAALVGPNGDQSVELSDTKYCFLEYIGRQRHHSVDQLDFARLFNLTAASIHGYRKELIKRQFVDKRIVLCDISKKAKNSIFLTLQRFSHLASRSNMSLPHLIGNSITQFLDEQPEKTAGFELIEERLAKKLPYLVSKKSWMGALKKTYRLLRDMKIIQVVHDNNTEMESLKLLKKLNDEEDDVAEDESSSNYDPTTCCLVAELPLGVQVYNLIDRMQHRPQGVSCDDLTKFLHLDSRFLQRLLDRSLLKSNLITYKLCDEGRQLIRKFQTVNQVVESTPKKEAHTDTQIVASTSDTTASLSKQTSERYMKRRQKILEMIRKNRAQEGCFGMLREIRKEEKQEGRTTKCDRRSVLRIVERLEKEGLCQTFSTVVMSADGPMSRSVNFVLDANVEQNDPKVLHITQQIKFRMANSKAHCPEPHQLKNKRRKKRRIGGSNKVKQGKPKKKKQRVTFANKRITAYKTLAQPSDGETKQVPRLRNPAQSSSTERKKNRENDKDDEDMDVSERQHTKNRTVYGLLQKMEKIRVLHRFMWYVLYGMPRHQSREALQPVQAVSGDQIPIIKQEFDENQQNEATQQLDRTLHESYTATQSQCLGISTNQSGLTLPVASQSDELSQSFNSVNNQTDVLIGRLDHGGQSACQSQMSVHAIDQSEKMFGASHGNSNPLEPVIGEKNRSVEAEETTEHMIADRRQDTSTISEMNIQTHIPETANVQSATDLLELIESGSLLDQYTTSSATRPGSISASSVSNINHDHSPSTSGQDTQTLIPTNAKVYLDVMDWRRFVQPLPEHQDIPKGWCFLGDLLMSMPLVTFCEMVSQKYMIEGLEVYLKDPLLRLLLVKDLPGNITKKLLGERRYLYRLQSVADHMCALGLGVFCARQNVDKEMISIYICRNVTLVDTTSSERGSYFVSDKSYPSQTHYLGTLDDVEKFWFDMKMICIDTPLGCAANTKLKTVTDLARKVDSYLDLVDDGRIPGDGMGAGGFDSKLLCHLKRNWTVDTINADYMTKQRYQNRFERTTNKATERLRNPLKPKTVLLTSRTGAKENVVVKTRSVDVDEHKAETVGGKGQKRKRSSAPKVESEAKIARKKRREEKKKVKEEKKLQQKQKRAVGIITRKVFTWSPAEDSLLLLCKVASALLNRDKAITSFISWETVQQVFSKKVPNAINLEMKDAGVLAKRSTRLMHHPEFRMNFRVCLGEVKEDKAFLDSIKPRPDRCFQTVAEEYEELLDRLQAKFTFVDGFNNILPDDIPSLHSNYSVVPMAQMDSTNKVFFKDENATDLRRLTLHTILMITLNTQSCSDYNARLVFNLFNQYDESLLHDVFLFCRTQGVVSRNKAAKRRFAGCLPVKHHLSPTYFKLFKKSMPQELPSEATNCYRKLQKSAPKEDVSFPNVTCGACACQIFLISTDQVNCKIIIPKKVIVLDSTLIDQTFLQKSGLLKKDGDSSDSDSDSEDDTDDEEDEEEEQDGDERTDIQVDVKRVVDRTSQGIGVRDSGQSVVGVRFEDEDDKDKTSIMAEPMGDQSLVVNLGNSAISNTDDENVMDKLNELAEGVSSTNVDQQPSDTTESQMPSFQQSVRDMDHCYFQTINQPAVSCSGDREVCREDTLPPCESTLSGAGDASSIASQEAKSSDLQPTAQAAIIQKKTVSTSFSHQEVASLDKVNLKPQLRNATMKCLTASQSSFTKWMIVQGLYAPGVCGRRISALQDNIALNAFNIKLHMKETNPVCRGEAHQEFRPCASLLEYLLRPCEKIVQMEPFCKSSDFSQEASYLDELCKGKVIKQEMASSQELTKRFIENGLDMTSTSVVIQIYEKITEAGFHGMVVEEVKRIVGRITAGSTVEIPLEKCITMLLEQHMIVEVGANDLRLVATKHASLWMVHSQKLVNRIQCADSSSHTKRPCLDKPSDIGTDAPSSSSMVEKEIRNIETVDLTEDPFENISKSGPGQRLSPVSGSSQAAEVIPQDDNCGQGSQVKGDQEVTIIQSPENVTEEIEEVVEDGIAAVKQGSDGTQVATSAGGHPSTDSDPSRATKRKFAKVFEGIYEPVEFVPYPWLKMDGEVNQPELVRIIKGIVLQILSEPGIKELEIVYRFKDVFRKVHMLKLLQIMSDLGLITRHCVTLPKPKLFGTAETRPQPKVYFYQPTINCLVKMGALFGDQE